MTTCLSLPQDALLSWRKKAYDRFVALGFPKPKQDGFQYLPLTSLASIWPKPAIKTTVPKESLALLSEFHLIFVDGHYDAALSNIPAGLICLPLDAALKSYGLFLQNRWTKMDREETDPLFALNGAQQNGGAFLYAPPKAKFDQTLHILHVSTGSQLASPRLQITLGKEASLSLVQTTQIFGAAPFHNSGIDIALEQGAHAKLLDVQLLPKEAWVFTGLRSTLKRDARLEVFHATNGSRAERFSAKFELTEENSSALLQGLCMLSEERHAHMHAHVEHAAPHCHSRQHIKMALNGKSRSSFEGKIYVHPIAQKTEAYQLNNNLLLSDEASANAKPNLEIYADDVKASHGATVTQLSDEALFYLRTRGLSTAAAQSLLVEGFCRELIDPIQDLTLRAALLAEMNRALR